MSEKYYDRDAFMSELELKKDFSYIAYDNGCMPVDYYGYYKMHGDTIQFICAHMIEDQLEPKQISNTEKQSCGHRTLTYNEDYVNDYAPLLVKLSQQWYIYKQDSIQLPDDEYGYHMYIEKYVHKSDSY